ncbi:hypothetical protein AMS68_003825 [Peltaster fructicola]|uniref:Heterokaryon incompatibility domain-containing protein n=1 Tax=Peltaster fructicola TaxID=286661 RepID=A0A6H0XUL9_9PEZI|nr:hypothetical protein AMS68_003825 [Peltaster fructicola]
MPRRYRYTQLKPTEIRLIHLLPGPELSARIVHYARYNAPPYTAISYCWGVEPASIKISRYKTKALEKKLQDSLTITQNLHDALSHSQHTGSVVWADAICINQSDDIEKSEQVASMSAIYRHARKTVVWLGRDTLDFGAFFTLKAFLDDRGDDLEEFRKGGWSLLVANGFFFEQNKEQVEDMRTLYKSPWFTRLWVVQEIAASKSVLVAHGNSTMPWSTLAVVTGGLSEPSWLGSFLDSLKPVYSTCGIERVKHKTTIDQTIIMMSMELECRDPRDRWFALCSLVPTRAQRLQPDYTKTAEDVFTDLSIEILTSGELWILEDAGVKGRSMPSWVCDLSERTTNHATNAHCNSGGRSSEVNFHDRILESRMYMVDTIHLTVTGVDCGSYNQDPIRGVWETRRVSFVVRTLISQPYITGEDEKDAYLRVLTCDSNHFGKPCNESDLCGLDLESQQLQAAETLAMIESIAYSAGATEASQYELMNGLFTWAKSFVLGERGFVGWVSPEAETGDKICIMPGLRVPVILRETDTPGTFILIGTAYIHGLMYDIVEDLEVLPEKKHLVPDKAVMVKIV